MRLLIKLASVAITFLLASCKAEAQQKDDYSAKIDSLIKTTTPRIFNGVVFIQQNGKEKYYKAFGYADFNKKTPLEINDRFSTMSIAKQITATLILQEVEKGTIDLNVQFENIYRISNMLGQIALPFIIC